MTDEEFTRRVLDIDKRPISKLEERWHDVQCASDGARVYMARLDRLIARYNRERDGVQ